MAKYKPILLPPAKPRFSGQLTCVIKGKSFFKNGKLKDVSEFNSDGETVNGKKYSINGTLLYSTIANDNIKTTYLFYENGKIQSESTSRTETDSNEEGSSKTIYESTNKYYENGEMKEHTFYVDGDIQGEKNVWDDKGNLILVVTYKDGLIVPK